MGKFHDFRKKERGSWWEFAATIIGGIIMLALLQIFGFIGTLCLIIAVLVGMWFIKHLD